MKKNISFIRMDSALAKWLLQKLVKEPPPSDCTAELLAGVTDMLSGEVTSLLLSTDAEAEAACVQQLSLIHISEPTRLL